MTCELDPLGDQDNDRVCTSDGNGIGDACAMVPVDGQFAIAAADPQSLYNDKMKSSGARLDRAIKADSKIGFRVASLL